MSKYSIREDSTNYACTVVKLPIKQKIEGLDNLVQVEVFGNSCLIGKDSDPNQLYLFFQAGTQLSDRFLHHNNLYRDSQLNKDPEQKGFFEPNGRVKGLKLKGIVSNGFVIPTTSLHYVNDLENVEVGDEFTDIHDENICKKYISPNQTTANGEPKTPKEKIGNSARNLLIPNQFRFHEETSHFDKNLHQYKLGDILVITDKWHGSSAILSKVYIRRKLKWWQRLFNMLGAEISNRQYGYVYSSGKPKSNLPKGILTTNETEQYKNNNSSYYTGNIWKTAFDDYKYAIEDGISIYGELVGFTPDGGYIQKGYDYGCNKEGFKNEKDYLLEKISTQYRFVVYKITYTKEDGNVITFSWQQLKDYCAKYKLEHVKELFFGSIYQWVATNSENPGQELRDGIMKNGFNLEKNCTHCKNRVPAEGIVITIDGKPHFTAFKLKSKLFTHAESNSDDVDTEANQ